MKAVLELFNKIKKPYQTNTNTNTNLSNTPRNTNKKRRRIPRNVKGVYLYRGKYYRYMPEHRKKLTTITKLPLSPINTAPLKFKNPASSLTEGITTTSEGIGNVVAATTANNGNKITKTALSSSSWFHAWWNENWAVLVLNFGSICTLVGFTRSDVLELRVLSIVGNICFICYQMVQNPIRYVPIGWSALFAAVNLFKTNEIILERNGKVTFTVQQEHIYNDHFRHHGVTPKQFEAILQRSSIRRLPKHHIILKQNTMIPKEVYLVVEGHTLAHNPLGRHLTAISSKPSNKQEKEGGDSGAWIGEMAFLKWWNWKERNHSKRKKEYRSTTNSWNKDNTTTQKSNDNKNTTTTTSNNNETTATSKQHQPSFYFSDINTNPTVYTSPIAMYSVTTQTDCTLLCWTYEDMAGLHQKSPDLRAGLMRSMTAAIVGKVINFTVSKSNQQAPQQTQELLQQLWQHLFQRSNDSTAVVGMPPSSSLISNTTNDMAILQEEEEHEE